MRPLYQVIANALQARANCARMNNNTEWFGRWSDLLDHIADEHLPHGSGIDSGCSIDLERSISERIVIHTSFHHMNDAGYYDGWTSHTITVKPSLASDFTLTISGRNRNDIKEYLHDLFDACLREPVDEYPSEHGID